MNKLITATLQRAEFQATGNLNSLICFYEFAALEHFQLRSQFALGSHALSIFLYQFKDQRFYLSKCMQGPTFDPALVGSNVVGHTLAEVVKRCLGFNLDPVTQQFENPADEIVFLLSYEKYLNNR